MADGTETSLIAQITASPWWGFALDIAALSGGVFGLVAFVQSRRKSPDKVISELREFPKQASEELAERLRGGRFGRLYPDLLERGLDGLDRLFGPARSWDALGVCFLMALCYAYAAFVLGWAFLGAPGTLGDLELLPPRLDLSQRALIAFLTVGLPPIAFFLGRWLGASERRFKQWLQARWSSGRFELAYRLIGGLVVGTLVWTLWLATENGDVAFGVFFGAMVVFGPIAGMWAAKRSQRRPIQWLLALVLGATAGAVAGAVAAAVAAAGAVAGAVAAAGAVAVAAAVAAAAAVAGAVAGAVGAVIGSSDDPTRRQAAFVGGLGTLVGIGTFVAFVGNKLGANELAIVVLVFFAVLPLVNSVWDWGSWWVTRGLGQHLLDRLPASPAQSVGAAVAPATDDSAAAGAGQRVVIALAHGLVDLLLAIGFLTTLAFLLAFGFQAYNEFAEWLSSGPNQAGRAAYELSCWSIRRSKSRSATGCG